MEQSYSEKHAHMLHKHEDAFELLYIAAGEGRYQVGNREYAVYPENLVICNANTLHGEAPFQANTMQTYCCRLSGLFLPGLPPNCLIPADQRPVLALTHEAAEVSRLFPVLYNLYASPECTQTICRHLALSIFLLVGHMLSSPAAQNKRALGQKNEDLVRAITDCLDRHYTENISLEAISEELHISVSYLCHLFKKETGLSPIQYIIQRRVGEAQSLLMETDLPIHVIEEKLGFNSSCHLTTTFKKYVGISPRAYRKLFPLENNKK